MRIGQGFDVHRFSADPGRPLTLGGVEVPAGRGLEGHSDADVVAHALADAVLGGAGLGDLGRIFPDTDPAWKDADSVVLLADVVGRAGRTGLRVVNADCTVIAQAPRLARHLPDMEAVLGRALGAPVSVKATTARTYGGVGTPRGGRLHGRGVDDRGRRSSGDRGPGGPVTGRRPGTGAGRRRGGPAARGAPSEDPRRSRTGRRGGTGGARGSTRGEPAGHSAVTARRSGRRSPGRPGPSGLGGEQVEGRRAVRELLAVHRRPVRRLWMASDLDPSPQLDEIERLAGRRHVRVETVSRDKLMAEARTESPQGVIAWAQPVPSVGLDELCQPVGQRVPFLLVVAGVTDPHNLGSLIRSAECAGVDGIVLPSHRTARLTPTAAKVAAGAVEHLRFAVVAGIPTALERLSARGLWSVGLAGEARTSLYDLAVADAPLALVVGSEEKGLPPLVRRRCDTVVSIPHHGSLPSLNVAAAAAVACFSIARQRATAT